MAQQYKGPKGKLVDVFSVNSSGSMPEETYKSRREGLQRLRQQSPGAFQNLKKLANNRGTDADKLLDEREMGQLDRALIDAKCSRDYDNLSVLDDWDKNGGLSSHYTPEYMLSVGGRPFSPRLWAAEVEKIQTFLEKNPQWEKELFMAGKDPVRPDKAITEQSALPQGDEAKFAKTLDSNKRLFVTALQQAGLAQHNGVMTLKAQAAVPQYGRDNRR